MAEFQTFDLGRVMQTAETIKGMRNQAADDNLRRQYLGTQITGAQQQQDIQAQQNAAGQQEMAAKRQYYTAQAALSSTDPKGTIEAIAPQFVKDFESKHGQGSWQQVTPEQAHAAAQQIAQQAQTIIGPQQKVKWLDLGGKQVPVDELTGQPINGAASLAKTATPDAQLSAQTSTANSAATNATSRANNTATVGATTRGQDLTAQTAADKLAVDKATAGGKLTETQGNAKGFGLRATAANDSIEKMLGTKGFDPTGVGMVKDMKTAGNPLTNWAASSAGQHYLNLAEGFISPILRKESGAAISDSERKQAFALYIPMPGDDGEVIKQKAENRKNAINSLSVQAGPGGIPANPASSGGWSIQPVP